MVHRRLLKDSWETLLRRQAGVDVALCRLLYLRELSRLHAVTGKTLLSGSSYWSGDYQMIRHQPSEKPQRASEAKQRELIPLLEQLLPLLEENRALRLSPGTPRPASGCVIPVGGVLSPSGAPLLLGDTFTEPLSGRTARISGASLQGAQVVPHGGGYQASLDALTLACRVRVTACLNQCRDSVSLGLASLQEHSLLKESTRELALACRRSQQCLVHAACELERQRERARSLADSGGSWGLMKYPGTQLLLPAVAGVGYPDPGGSGLEVPLLGVQGDGSRGELVPLAGTMEDPDGKGNAPHYSNTAGGNDTLGGADKHPTPQPDFQFAGILNPTVCLSLGDVLVFTVSKEHYPVYDVGNLLNTNSRFDWGGFRALAEEMSLSHAASKLFSFPFTQPGVYVLKLNSNQHKKMILFREFGWPEKKPADPKYRKLHLKYNFDDYSSKGSTVLTLKKLHRSLQRQECEEELGNRAAQVDEFWDYEQQIDLEAFDTNLFYGILLKHTVSVTTRLSQLKDEVKVLYQKTLRETESLKELLVSWTNLSGNGKLASTAVLESFERKRREVEAEVGRRKALAVEFGRLLEKQLQLLAEDWRSREEHHVSFSAALLEAQRLLEQLCEEEEGRASLSEQLCEEEEDRASLSEQLCELEGRASLSEQLCEEEEGRASLLTRRLASLLAQMSGEVTRECQRLRAWGVLGDGTGAHLLSSSKAEILTREDLLAPDGTVRACDVVHVDPLTGLIVPNADAQMLSAGGSPVPVPRDLCVNPHTGKLLPVAGNVAFDPVRSTLVFTADCSAGELSKWEEPPIPFVPFPVCSRTGLPVKCTLGGLDPGRDLKLGGPMADPATGAPVPTLGVTIHPQTGRVHPLGGTYVSPLTKLLESIEIGGVMVHRHTGRVVPIIGVSLDPHSGLAEEKQVCL
ncbi:hypothetical protein EOD39_17262 [Acipenser ruthenus]|uniref:Uncharacterized protein n=1 Tax=Acipenser ruthenus TaxID=7906 RepID=A0A444V3V4_ACIRT|nr:hypothetical protein EOD39_17262 [Acipenser ruthenus]